MFYMNGIPASCNFDYLFPTLPTDFWLRTVGAVVAFLAAVEALAWLVVSSVVRASHICSLADL